MNKKGFKVLALRRRVGFVGEAQGKEIKPALPLG